MTASGRIRADQRLVDERLVESREQARRLILAGKVRAGDRVIGRPGERIDPSVTLQVVAPAMPFASRGGAKLEAALQRIPVPVNGAICMDVGASTGGFTDCLLQHGARRVYAVDVGYGQLAWKLRTDPRVVVLERTNIRYLDPARIGEPVDVVTVDVSFISLTRFLDRLPLFMKPEGWAVALVKPQFEAGRSQVKKGGVVKDPLVHAQVMRAVTGAALDAGFEVVGVMPSPLLGPKGNVEFLLALTRAPGVGVREAASVEPMIDEALARSPGPPGAAGAKEADDPRSGE